MNTQATFFTERTAQSFPSLSFQVAKDRCSITARCVSSIMLMPDVVVHFPEAPPYCRGLIHLRGQVIPLLDTRILFGSPALEQEYADFRAMMDDCKQEQTAWAAELARCMAADARFPLPADRRHCALGKWVSSFSSGSTAVMSHLSKLDELHRLLWDAAGRYDECKQRRAGYERDQEVKQEAEAALAQYTPLLLNLLDEAKDVFLSSCQAIVIVLEGRQGMLGLIVDQVHSVETVIPIDEDQSNQYFSRSPFISGVAKSEKTGQLLLALNHEALLDLCLGLQY